MKVLSRNLLTAAALVVVLSFSTAGSAAAQAGRAPDPAAGLADRDFMQAAAKPDAAALGKLLDADFVWIDANGKLENRAQVLASVPKQAIPMLVANAEGPTSIHWHNYGRVDVAEIDHGKMHVMRIWVKRAAGWRALVYQEVESLGAPPKTTPSAGKDCQNPCKSVGYTPKNETEQAIITAYQGLETSAMAQDAADWDAHTGEEFIAASSYSDRLLDKPTRMAELNRKNMAGLAPTPLVSGKLFVFGDAAVLRSHHVANQAKPLEVTRVFVKRNGKWVETASYQTAVQGGATS
jgi:uncharacterized protein DUF4440